MEREKPHWSLKTMRTVKCLVDSVSISGGIFSLLIEQSMPPTYRKIGSNTNDDHVKIHINYIQAKYIHTYIAAIIHEPGKLDVHVIN